MTDKERIEKAKKQALEYMDFLLDVYSTPTFVEIVGSVGGDIIKRRYYDNGIVADK